MVAQTVLGSQTPTFEHFPISTSSAGRDVIDFAKSVGVVLDPWQQHVLDHAYGETPDRRWASFEVGLVVPRQCGKNEIIVAAELTSAYLFGLDLIVHTAHLYPTAHEAFLRTKFLVESSDTLSKLTHKINIAPGAAQIELKNGSRIKWAARGVTGAGRGMSPDLVVLDEAHKCPIEAVDAVLPALSARPNPQLWYVSSAGDAESTVLAAVRARAQARGEKLSWFEWSADPSDNPADRAVWAKTNPALGIRLSVEQVAREFESLTAASFARERLGRWDSTFGGGNDQHVIEDGAWQALTDPLSTIAGQAVFGIDVSYDRSTASIGAAGTRADGQAHIELIESRAGVDWLIDRAVSLSQYGTQFVVDASGPAANLIAPLTDKGLTVIVTSAQDMARACSSFSDHVAAGTVHHLGQQPLTDALRSARVRTLGESWAWGRRRSTDDISPLVACTLALFGVSQGADYDVLSSIG